MNFDVIKSTTDYTDSKDNAEDLTQRRKDAEKTGYWLNSKNAFFAPLRLCVNEFAPHYSSVVRFPGYISAAHYDAFALVISLTQIAKNRIVRGGSLAVY